MTEVAAILFLVEQHVRLRFGLIYFTAEYPHGQMHQVEMNPDVMGFLNECIARLEPKEPTGIVCGGAS